MKGSMVSLRCTGRLLKRLRQTPASELPQPTNRLGDWYANLLNIGPHRLVLCTSERTLLTLIVPIRDSSHLRERIQESAHRLLLSLGVPPGLAQEEVAGMYEMAFGATANRSVLGSMNDFVQMTKHYFQAEREAVYLDELELFLAETLCGPLEYNNPGEETLRAFGVA